MPLRQFIGIAAREAAGGDPPQNALFVRLQIVELAAQQVARKLVRIGLAPHAFASASAISVRVGAMP